MIVVNDLLNCPLGLEGGLPGETALTFVARERLQDLCNQAKARGTTQKALARRIGEGPMWITNRLTGHSQIHADDVPRIAEMFGMDLCAFYTPRSGPEFSSEWEPARASVDPLSNNALQLASDLIAAFRFLPDESRSRLRALLDQQDIDIDRQPRIVE